MTVLKYNAEFASQIMSEIPFQKNRIELTIKY